MTLASGRLPLIYVFLKTVLGSRLLRDSIFKRFSSSQRAQNHVILVAIHPTFFSRFMSIGQPFSTHFNTMNVVIQFYQTTATDIAIISILHFWQQYSKTSLIVSNIADKNSFQKILLFIPFRNINY